MDNLTHTLTGLMMSRAGLSRFHPEASGILMIAANIPDIDVVSLVLGRVEYLHYHRWLTHALAALPVMAVAAVMFSLPLLRGAPKKWRAALGLSAAGVLSHLLLDWTNMYGIRLLLPFDATWYNLSFTNVFDLWIWAVYGFAVFWPFLSKLVNSEIGARPGAGRGIAIFALLFAVAYNGGRGVLHARAVALQENRVYEGRAPLKVIAVPGPLSPLAWRGIVETRSAFYVSDLNLLFDFDPTAARAYHKPEQIAGGEALLRSRPFKIFADFSPALLFRNHAQTDPPGSVRVEAVDLRFGEPADSAFRLSAIVDSAGRMVQVLR